MTIDAIALAHATDLDRVYPPMRWTAKWSDGSNIPLGLRVSNEMARALRAPDYYEPGLWLFSDDGHGHRIEGLGPERAGRIVTAWNPREAEARLREAHHAR